MGLGGGEATTVHLARYPLRRTAVRLGLSRPPRPLPVWCARAGASEAIVAGFFLRPGGEPLGELRTRGVRRRSAPFDPPWDGVRACLSISGARIAIARRDALPSAPRGDLLQAGPLLMAGGAVLARDGEDPEGFAAGAGQFDSDITAGRHPRAALALAGRELLALACDGRAGDEAGLTLGELASLLAELGARDAINLDGGGSTSLVCDGRLCNRPRADIGVEIPGGRPVTTALFFSPVA